MYTQQYDGVVCHMYMCGCRACDGRAYMHVEGCSTFVEQLNDRLTTFAMINIYMDR